MRVELPGQKARRPKAEAFGSCLLFALALLALLVVPPRASAVPSSSACLRLNGTEYIRLTDWTRTHGFAASWLKRDETLQLSSSTANVRLEIHSLEAQINGVQVRLLFPLVPNSGTVYISQRDLQKTFAPLLYPPKAPGTRIKTICLDAGHGGKDPGYRVGSNYEKNYTLLLAKELRDRLTAAGFKVVLTRSTDTFIELGERPELARKCHADLFLSLHFNATEGSRNSVQGVEVYGLTPAWAASSNSGGEGSHTGAYTGNQFDDRNMFLSYQLQKTLTRTLGAEDRSVRRARFAVLREAPMPAALIEGGYMSHPTEGKKIFTWAYRRQMADAIVQAVQAYKRTVEQSR